LIVASTHHLEQARGIKLGTWDDAGCICEVLAIADMEKKDREEKEAGVYPAQSRKSP